MWYQEIPRQLYKISLWAYFNMSLRYACFIDETFSGNKQISGIGITLLHCQINRISEILDVRWKEFYYIYHVPCILHIVPISSSFDLIPS